MRDFQENNRWRAFFASRAVLSILLLLFIGMGIISFRALEAGWEAEAERTAVKEHLRELEEKKGVLTTELEDLRSQEGIEREARQKLNLRKPGEEVVIIRDAKTDSTQNKDVQSSSFIKSIKEFLISNFGILWRFWILLEIR